MRLFLILSSLFLAAMASAQPACVSTNCCCGDPLEIGVPCGDFESAPWANPIIVIPAGQSFCDWQVLQGSIDILGPNYLNWAQGNPNGASQYIDLHGDNPGVMVNTLSGLIAGYQYTLTLWYAKNAGVGSANCRVQVAGGAWLDETFTATNNGANGWLEQCYTFTAQGTTAELRISGSGGAPNAGVLLDDISLWGCPADTEDPVVQNTPPTLLILDCSEPVPPADDLIVTDNCPGDIQIAFSEQQQNQPCYYDLLRTWTVTDGCGNSITLTQTIQVRDNEAPVFLGPPGDYVTLCGGDYLQEFYQWIQNNGGGFASDNCDPGFNWSADYGQEPDGSCGSVPVVFTVTDACGNTNSAEVLFIIADNDPPTLLQPAVDRVVYCPVNPLDSIQAWLILQGGAQASDPCGPVTWSNDFLGDVSNPAIPVTFTATDACGNSAETTAFFFQVLGSDTLVQQAFTCDPLLAGSDTLVVTIEGCTSVTITQTLLQPSDTVRLDARVCDPALVGMDTLILSNAAGCDSLIITHNLSGIPDTTFLFDGTCDPAQTGTFLSVLPGQYCDSLILRTVILLPSDETLLTVYTCDPAQAGRDSILLMNQSGCDSLVITATVYSGQFILEQSLSICGNDQPYTDTVIVTGGPCDSLFITHYQYQPTDSTLLSASTCDPAMAGIFEALLTNQYGCDSLVRREVALLASDTTWIIGKVCDIGQALHDTLWLLNQAGCDSLVFIDIAWVGVDTQFLTMYSCDPGQTGSVVTVIPGPFCDTVRVTETLWVPFTTGTETILSCEPQGPASDTLFLINSAGCDSVHIRQYSYSDLQGQTTLQDERCAGAGDGQIILSPSGGQAPYDFRLPGGPWQQDGVFGGLAPGVYTLVLRDGLGCERMYSGLTVGGGESVLVEAGPDLELEAGETVTLSLSSTSQLSIIQWSAVDPLGCPTCPMTSLGPLSAGQTVSLQVWSAAGCPGGDALQITLRSVERPAVYIPNSFSPNADGINDLFSVYGNDQVVAVRRLAIYDRWGNALYDRADLPLNDPSAGWDGYFRGKPMDPGVYIYIAVIERADGQTRLYKGDIHLVR
jgi:gliding motility-associated-like protein